MNGNKGRPTSDKKDYTVKVRINEDTKKWLSNKSKQNNITVSEFIRDMLENNRKRGNDKCDVR